jgi:peptide/nickel transport system substrate-binding protein
VWSDGVPVTAQDFIYAWESQRGVGDDVDGKPYDVASTLGYRDIDSITPSADGKTVTVLFGTPFTDWRALFANMVPAHIAEQVGWNSGFQTFNPARDLSAGPMTIQSVSSNGTVVLVPNSKWWGAKPRLSKVVVKENQSSTASIGALSNSKRTVSQPNGFDLSDLNRVTSLPNVQSQIRNSMQFLQLEFNVRSPVTGTLAVRQAIAHSLDRSKLLNDTLGSVQGSPAVDNDHLAVNSQPQYATSQASAAYAGVNAGAADTLTGCRGCVSTAMTFWRCTPPRNGQSNARAPISVRLSSSSIPIAARVIPPAMIPASTVPRTRHATGRSATRSSASNSICWWPAI